MINFLQTVIEGSLKFLTGTLQRLLVFLSLVIPVVCCVSFLYGLYSHSPFYSFFSALGAVAFVYVNKQT